MLTRTQKEKIVEELKKASDDSKVVLMADFRGLNVKDMGELKKEIKSIGGKVKVARKTLMNRVLLEKGVEFDTRKFSGPLAFFFGKDETETAKRVWKFAKKNDKLQIEGGVLESVVIGRADIENLAKLPTKDQLLGQLLSVMQGPTRGLVGVTSGVIRSFVNVIKAIEDKSL